MNPARSHIVRTICFALAWTLASAASVYSEPGERIDPKSIKEKVSVTLGIKGTIQFRQQGNALTEPKLIKGGDDKTPGVGIEFKSSPFEKDRPMLMLNVENHYPKVLRYRAAMRLKGRKDYVETSIIPVLAGLMSGESWIDPIEELLLFEFKLTDEKME